MHHRLRSIALVLTLTLAIPVAAAASPDAWLIVPGQSLGVLRLGLPVQALLQTPGWGKPDRTHNAGSITYMFYDRFRVVVGAREDVVVILLTTNDRFRTDRGIGVGQAASAATAAYGQAAATGGDERVLWFDTIGLLAVTGGGVIVRIGVFDSKTLVRAMLAEERPARDIFLTARQPKYSKPPDPRPGAPARTAVVTVTLKNSGRTIKILNPNFLVLVDRSGRALRYDPSTFRQADACRSTVSVKPGESGSCSIVFVLFGGESARSIVFNDGASTDEAYF
ncbi:MAG: hypothetical protein ACT4PY_17395 [Armatimonadota bacterium]